MVDCGIPVLALEEILGEPVKIVEALERWGCFRLINHEIPLTLMSEMNSTVLSLFDLPVELKQRNVYPEPFMGYIPVGILGPVSESMGVFDLGEPGAIDQYSDQLEVSNHQREVMHKYLESVKILADKLGPKIMEGYGLAGDDLFKGWSRHLRLNRFYNNTQTIGTTVGSMHSDKSFLTILLDDEMVDGLEVLDDQTRQIVPVRTMPGAFLIIMGDMAKVWSNGRLCNVRHRIQSREPKERVSAAYFVLGPRDTKLEAPSKLVDSEHPQLYVPFSFNEYRNLYFSSYECANGGALEYFKYANH